MARQKGIIKIEGKLGGVTFFKTADGHLVWEKRGVDASRIKNDPALQRTRENGSEFGRAGKAGGLHRQAVRPLLQLSKDRLEVSWQWTEMIKVIRADSTSVRGLRNVIDGEAELLQGFDFNINAKFSSTVYAPYTATINRAFGELSVVLPSFFPAQAIAASAGTTHFKIVSAGTAIDFANNSFTTVTSETQFLAWDNTASKDLSLENQLSLNTTAPLFLLVGIQFYQEVNSVQYPLKSGSYKALSVVKVEGV